MNDEDDQLRCPRCEERKGSGSCQLMREADGQFWAMWESNSGGQHRHLRVVVQFFDRGGVSHRDEVMTLPLTPDVLRAAYDYLSTTPPFSKWNLPEGEDVTFEVVRSSRIFGCYDNPADKHRIRVSTKTVGHTHTLMVTMAHEMIHLHEQATGMATVSQHTKAFWKMADRVCKFHGFDLKAF